MGFGEVCGKLVLVLVNSIFMVLGILFFLLGIFLLAAEALVKRFVPVDISSQFEALLNQTTNAKDTVGLADTATKEFFGLFRDLGVVFLVFGLLILLLTILGCCGSCCSVRCMLISYVVFVSAILIVQAIAIGLYATKKLDDPIKTRLKDTLVKKYTGNFGLDVETLTINMLQAWVGCCGINDWTDFKDTTHWNRTEGFKVGNVTHVVQVAVPSTCCHFTGDFPISFSLVDEECPVNPSTNNSYINEGCFDAISDDLMSEKTIVLGVVGGLLGLELLCVLLGVFLIYAERAKNKGY